MPAFNHRAVQLREGLEDPGSDPDKVFNTYRQFAVVNRLFARWSSIYRRHLRPHMDDPGKTYTLLDIGFGGGDIPLRLLSWAARDGRKLEIVGIDRSERAMTAAGGRTWPPSIRLERTSAQDLRRVGRRFDFVISNHILHELSEHEVRQLLDDSLALAERQVVFNDVARGAWLAAGLVLTLGPFLRRSFTVADGVTSIRRAFTKKELRALAPEPWMVDVLFPGRLILTLRK